MQVAQRAGQPSELGLRPIHEALSGDLADGEPIGEENPFALQNECKSRVPLLSRRVFSTRPDFDRNAVTPRSTSASSGLGSPDARGGVASEGASQPTAGRPSESGLSVGNLVKHSSSSISSASTHMARWRDRRLAAQLCGVIRHTERADAAFATVGGQVWSSSLDFVAYPMDPPLSDLGMEAAGRIAQEVWDFVATSGSDLHVIISSPYFRCVQTAVEVCRRLGPGVKMLLDVAVSEVYGPHFFGETQPSGTMVRPIEDTVAYCERQGVTCRPFVLGHAPEWGESLLSARQRFAKRFIGYLRRSALTRRNFVIVTHSECVAAALSVMPSHAGLGIEKVDYGGMFLALRASQAQNTVSAQPSRASNDDETVVTKFSSLDTETDQEESNLVANERSLEERCIVDDAREEHELAVPEGAWQVVRSGIKMSKRTADAASYESRVRRLEDGKDLNRLRVEQLLGTLSNSPVGTGEELELNLHAQQESNGAFLRREGTAASLSTILFGADGSEVSATILRAKKGHVVHSQHPLWANSRQRSRESARPPVQGGGFSADAQRGESPRRGSKEFVGRGGSKDGSNGSGRINGISNRGVEAPGVVRPCNSPRRMAPATTTATADSPTEVRRSSQRTQAEVPLTLNSPLLHRRGQSAPSKAR